jgi:O-antigen/teichoic acid export membrane protein
MAIRGGMLRTAGYGANLLLSLVAAPLLLRHLGVVDFGGYVTVVSLVAIAGIVADAGLTVVAVREYAIRDAEGRRRLMANVTSLRVVIALAGAALAVLFALAAGYRSELVLGTAFAGIGLVLVITQQTFTVPLQARLRVGAITLLEVLKQSMTVALIVVLILLGATVTAFLAISIPVGAVAAVLTLIVVRRTVSMGPLAGRDEWRYLLRGALPVAAASILGALFYKSGVIVMSLVASAQETGLFSASLRVTEAVVPVPSLIASTAFPILVRAAEDSGGRLAYALQRLFEAGLILGAFSALFLVLGAEPLIDFVGGEEFEDAVPVLRVHGIATAATFLIAPWAAGLWAIQAQRSLVVASAVGLACLVALTLVLASEEGAIGAAIAMTVSEVLLALLAGALLVRRRPELRVKLAVVPKVLVAVAAAAALALLGLPPLVLVVLATLVYFGLLLALRGIPGDVWMALRGRVAESP